MPSVSAAAWAAARLRDAIAATSSAALLRIPGMTFWVPILAVDRMPQRTGFVVTSCSFSAFDAAC